IVSSNPKRDRLAMQLNIVLRLTCPQDRDRDAVNAPSCDPFQNVFVVFADSPAIDSDRRPDPSHNIVVHGAQIAVAGDRVLLLGAFSFTDEHWKRIGLLPFIDYSVEQRRSCSCRNLDLSALRMAREQQVPVWEEDERRPCDAVRRFKKLPITFEMRIPCHPTVLKPATAPDLVSLHHRPVDGKVVVERKHLVEPTHELLNWVEMVSNSGERSVVATNSFDECASESHVGISSPKIGYREGLVYVE